MPTEHQAARPEQGWSCAPGRQPVPGKGLPSTGWGAAAFSCLPPTHHGLRSPGLAQSRH